MEAARVLGVEELHLLAQVELQRRTVEVRRNMGLLHHMGKVSGSLDNKDQRSGAEEVLNDQMDESLFPHV